MPRSWTIDLAKWSEVGLPRTPEQWSLAANCTKIGKGDWPANTPPDPGYPEGQPALDVPLRQLGGWSSASKVQMAHFLTARILWKHKPVKCLLALDSDGQALGLDPAVRKEAMDCTAYFHHFQQYCDDIRSYGGTEPKDWNCDMSNLGPFSYVLDRQFLIRQDKVGPNESNDGPSSRTRSRTAHGGASDTDGALLNSSPNQADPGRNSATLQDEDMGKAEDQSGGLDIKDLDDDYNSDSPKPRTRTKHPQEGSGKDEDMGEAEDQSGGLDIMDLDDDSDSDSPKPRTRTKHPQEGSGESGGFTGHIKEFSDESAVVPQTNQLINSEAEVQGAFISLLGSLCLKRRNLDLRWFEGCDGTESKATLGKASIVATPDGRLRPKNLNESAQPEAIIEVKASVLLAKHTSKVLMQMGIEMMVWMHNCHKEHQEQRRYFMLCQHGHELWIVVGKCGPEYFKYLLEDNLSPEEKAAAFLKLALYGPFNIFNGDHMWCFGPLALAVTLQRDQDYKARVSSRVAGALSSSSIQRR